MIADFDSEAAALEVVAEANHIEINSESQLKQSIQANK